MLIYATLFITECLKKLIRCSTREQANAELYNLALTGITIPGDPGFPLNAVYSRPQRVEDLELLRQYFLQVRQEVGHRLIDRVFDRETGKPSKWWLCFAKRKFMDISLTAPGL